MRALRLACQRRRARDFFVPVLDPTWTMSWFRWEMVNAGWRAWQHEDGRVLTEDDIESILERRSGMRRKKI